MYGGGEGDEIEAGLQARARWGGRSVWLVWLVGLVRGMGVFSGEKGVVGREGWELLVLRIEGGRRDRTFNGGGIVMSEPVVEGRVRYSWAGIVRGGAGK